jgi:poly(3-hydroxybutyrate) depolymerase
MFFLDVVIAILLTFITFVSSSPIDSQTTSRRTVSGCGISHPIGGLGITTYHEVKSSARTRSYSIHLPSNYDSGHKYPLVVGFHGSSSVGLFLEVDTGLSLAKYSANVGSGEI